MAFMEMSLPEATAFVLFVICTVAFFVWVAYLALTK